MSAPNATPRDIRYSWIGYKLHIDAADGGIPLSCILTSASVNDCQVAIPLATMTAARVTNLYDLMDAAYDAAEIRAHSESLGHVPIIDVNPRNSAALKRDLQQVRATARERMKQAGGRRSVAVLYHPAPLRRSDSHPAHGGLGTGRRLRTCSPCGRPARFTTGRSGGQTYPGSAPLLLRCATALAG